MADSVDVRRVDADPSSLYWAQGRRPTLTVSRRTLAWYVIQDSSIAMISRILKSI